MQSGVFSDNCLQLNVGKSLWKLLTPCQALITSHSIIFADAVVQKFSLKVELNTSLWCLLVRSKNNLAHLCLKDWRSRNLPNLLAKNGLLNMLWVTKKWYYKQDNSDSSCSKQWSPQVMLNCGRNASNACAQLQLWMYRFLFAGCPLLNLSSTLIASIMSVTG